MELNNEYLFKEAQRMCRVGTFVYDIKKDICIKSDTLNEILEIENDYPNNFQSWLNTIDPNQRTEMKSYLENVIRNGSDFAKEYKVINPIDGTEIWVMQKGKVYFDEFGVPAKIAGAVHDISELKRSEEKYKKLYKEFEQKESLMVSLINSIPDLIFYKDINGVYIGCNKAVEAFIGMEEKDIIGHTDFDILDKKTAEFFRDNELKVIQQGEHIINEEVVTYPDGKSVLLNTLKTPYYDPNGNILGLIGVSRDITEKSKKEELQKSIEEEKRRLNEIREHNRIKTEFFANISHELRTPVNVIFLAIQMEEMMLKDQADKSGAKNKYLLMMKQNCYRLIRLINNLIDITKIDIGYFQIKEVNHDVISLIENVTLSVAEYIKDKDISITFDTDTEEKVIACDPEKIERIILNLLSNAVKFTPSGGSINVQIEDNINNICIRVKDTGRGIPASKLNYIFERFMQVDKSLKRSHEGSGIGLSIVRALVELHDGTISVMSEESIGTEFIIRIPCRLAEGEPCINNEGNEKINKCSIEKISIEFSDIYSK